MIFNARNFPEKLLLGYLVLNARVPPKFPFLPESFHPEGLPDRGSYNGVFACLASERHDFYYPQRDKHYKLYSTANYPELDSIQPVMEGFAEIYASGNADLSFQRNLEEMVMSRVEANSFLYIEQEHPYDFGALISKGVEVYLYGVYTEDFSILAWTNSPTLFEQSLFREYGNTYWVYRFLPRRDFTLMLFSSRICSRWYRWGQQDNFRPVSSRFPALERMLFRPEFNSKTTIEDGLQPHHPR